MTQEALTDAQQYAQLLPDAMRPLARRHSDVESTRLRLLRDDIVAYPAQDPGCTIFEGDRQEIAVIETVAAAAEPRFPDMMRRLGADPKVLSVIDKSGQHLNDKKNIWHITPHGDILDMAYIFVASYSLLHKQGYTPRKTIAILAKTLAWLGFELVPGEDPIQTVPTMGMQCDAVLLTHQKTESARRHNKKLPKTELDARNAQVSAFIDEEFEKGGVAAVMAPTATTSMKRTRTWGRSKSGALILPVPSKGTLQLMMKPDTLVLPVPAWFKSEEIIVDMPTDPIEVTEEARAHEMLKFMAEVLTELVPEENFVYKAPRRKLGTAALAALRRQPSPSA